MRALLIVFGLILIFQGNSMGWFLLIIALILMNEDSL
jgi:hypothetical protein